MEKEVEKLRHQLYQAKEEIFRLKQELAALKADTLDSSETEGQADVTDELAQDTSSITLNHSDGVHRRSSSEEKIALFLSLFRGRSDVCAKRWWTKPGYSPFCFNDFKPGICFKPKVKCIECKNQNFPPLDAKRVEEHLLGKYVLGLYPMTTKDTCYLLVMDFDESSYKDDASTVLDVSNELGTIPLLERSRSGNGCHLWYFFQDEVPASVARKFGMVLLTLAMKRSKSITFTSFDRLFPSQDYLESGGFGNLIALPLQKEARDIGNTIFLDCRFQELEDPWAALSQVKRITMEELERISGLLMDVFPEKEEYSPKKTSEKPSRKISKEDFPEMLRIVRAAGLEMFKEGLSANGLYYLRSLASYANPEFYAHQAMRRTTFGIPRVAVVYEETDDTIILPRGIEEVLITTLAQHGILFELEDERTTGDDLNISFSGTLRLQQQEALLALLERDSGVLSATTGFGKTVIGAALIGEKKCSTLILVHTKDLADQWKVRLEEFLEFHEGPYSLQGKKRKRAHVGQLGGGRSELTGKVDIALMQSLFEGDHSVKDVIHQYGMIIVDECHHVSAKNFMRVLESADARFVYGLTATPVRKDGHHPVIFMHCGPIRYQVSPKKEALVRGFDHYIIPRFSSLRLSPSENTGNVHISEIYKHLYESVLRNQLIVEDVEKVLKEGRTPLVLTERLEHVERLELLLKEKNIDVRVLTGQMKSKERRESIKLLEENAKEEPFVLLATGKLIGEGFDLPKLDTLMLAMPVAWKGTITQYVGRLHRPWSGKEEVRIYDYVDLFVPVLDRMYKKRLSAYKSLGYRLREEAMIQQSSSVFTYDNYMDALLQDIQQAKHSVIISEMYLKKMRMDLIFNVLQDSFQKGVQISVVVRPFVEHLETRGEYLKKQVDQLRRIGVNFIERCNNHLQTAVIDCQLVWYGDIGIFGDSNRDGTVIRVSDEGLANEIIGVLSNESTLSEVQESLF